MFNGIIKETGLIEQVNKITSGYEVIVNVSSALFADLIPLSTIAINGKALTLVDKSIINNQFYFSFHFHSEPTFTVKQRVNLERAVRLGEEISSSLFSGIPCGRSQLVSVDFSNENIVNWQVNWQDKLVNYLDPKDILCLDGVLLGIKDIANNNLFFSIYEETLKLTNLGDKSEGDWLNIEIDPTLKKIAQILEKKLIY